MANKLSYRKKSESSDLTVHFQGAAAVAVVIMVLAASMYALLLS